MFEDQEHIGEEALHHIRTMYPGLWEKFSESAKKSLKNHINNSSNLDIRTAYAKGLLRAVRICGDHCCDKNCDMDAGGGCYKCDSVLAKTIRAEAESLTKTQREEE